MKKLDWKTCFKVGASVFLLYLCIIYWSKIVSFLGLFTSAAAPIFVGLVLAYAINILMSFYEKHFFKKSDKKIVKKMRRPLCLVASLLTLVGIVTLVICLVAPQLVECLKLVFEKAPAALETATNKLEGFGFVPEKIIAEITTIDWQSKFDTIAQTLSSGVGNVLTVAAAAVSSVFSVATTSLIGLIFAIYLLLDKDRLISQLNRVKNKFVPEKANKKLTHILSIANDSFHRFIVGQCTEAVILGSLCMVGMLILRLPYAPMIGALIAFTALIPIVGAFLGAGIGAFLILMVSPTKALIFIIFIIILQQIEGNLIYPKVVGSSMGLPGIWVLVAVTIGGGVLGIPGMLIGVPLMSVIYKLVREGMAYDKNAEMGKEPVEEAAKPSIVVENDEQGN